MLPVHIKGPRHPTKCLFEIRFSCKWPFNADMELLKDFCKILWQIEKVFSTVIANTSPDLMHA
jgi:hypothetical protein